MWLLEPDRKRAGEDGLGAEPEACPGRGRAIVPSDRAGSGRGRGLSSVATLSVSVQVALREPAALTACHVAGEVSRQETSSGMRPVRLCASGRRKHSAGRNRGNDDGRSTTNTAAVEEAGGEPRTVVHPRAAAPRLDHRGAGAVPRERGSRRPECDGAGGMRIPPLPPHAQDPLWAPLSHTRVRTRPEGPVERGRAAPGMGGRHRRTSRRRAHTPTATPPERTGRRATAQPRPLKHRARAPGPTYPSRPTPRASRVCSAVSFCCLWWVRVLLRKAPSRMRCSPPSVSVRTSVWARGTRASISLWLRQGK